MIEINQETLATILQLSGQYFFPAAALLRALYSGYRGKLPEGFSQIAAASAFAGVSSLADGQQPDLQSMVLSVAGNSVFMTGLLGFIVVYLLRVRFLGMLVDAIVGALLALAAWGVWVYVLGNQELRLGLIPVSMLGVGDDMPLVLAADLATLPFVAAFGAIVFVLLRLGMRQIRRLMGCASVFVVLGIVALLAAGALYLAGQTGLVSLQDLPIPR